MTFRHLTIALFFIAAYAHSAGVSAASDSKSHKQKGKAAHHAKTAPKVSTGPLYRSRPDVMEQADAIAQRRGLDTAWVRSRIGQAHYMPGIAKAVLPPPVGTPKNWTAYHDRFVEPIRIQAGVRFWQANADALARAEEQTGVPAAIIVGIVGVETLYGQHTGNYRVMDALCTLAFDFPKEHPRAKERTALFLSELEAFLALTQRTGTDPMALRGSYAGAMGLPQFMPSSWDKYAVDFDGDGHTDLFHSPTDVIGSVANYFKAFQWKPGMPTHYPAQFDAATLDKATLLAPDIRPTFSAADMVAKGVLLDAQALQHIGPLALVELQDGGREPVYVIGTENFFAVTRYNWSSYYALAVIELGQAITQAMPQATLQAMPAASAMPK